MHKFVISHHWPPFPQVSVGDDWVDWLIYVHRWVLQAGVTIGIGWDKSRGTDPTKSDWKKVGNIDMQQAEQPKKFFLIYKPHHIITFSLQSGHFEISRFKSYITLLVITCPRLSVPSFSQLSVQMFINRTWNMWGWRIKGATCCGMLPEPAALTPGAWITCWAPALCLLGTCVFTSWPFFPTCNSMLWLKATTILLFNHCKTAPLWSWWTRCYAYKSSD